MKKLQAIALLAVLASSPALAHGDHDTGSAQGVERRASWWLELVPRAAAAQQMEIDERQGLRFIRADGLPDHATGAFPNVSNPNRIAAQTYFFRLPLRPAKTGRADYISTQSPVRRGGERRRVRSQHRRVLER